MSITFSKILHPTDFSELSLHALGFARRLVEVFDAQLHCLHVIDEAYQYWSAVGPEMAPVTPPVEDLTSLAEAQMHRFFDEHLVGLKYPAVTKVVFGKPFAEIVQYAREANIDLIVLPTHGRGGLTHMLLGSTAEKVVRKAPCPVLTIRDPNQNVVLP